MSGEAERPVLEVMRQIKAGTLDPQRLAAGERQACVTHLWGEGLSVVEIAQVLKRSERTIARDRQAIQRASALTHYPEFAGEVGGRLLSEAELSIGRIRRVTRASDTPPAVRVEGERACFAIWVALCQRLQSLGYLPNAAQKIEAQLTHHSAEPVLSKNSIAPEGRLRTPGLEGGARFCGARNTHCALNSHETAGEFPPYASYAASRW